MTIAYVRWRDACHDMGECDIEDLGGLYELQEIGWLLKESEDSVTIGIEHAEGATSARMWLTVPRVNIVEFKTTTLAKAFKGPRKKTR